MPPTLSFRELMRKKRQNDSHQSFRPDDSVRIFLTAKGEDFDESFTSLGSCLDSLDSLDGSFNSLSFGADEEDAAFDMSEKGSDEDGAASFRRRGVSRSSSFSRRTRRANHRRISLTGDGGVVRRTPRKMTPEQSRQSSLMGFMEEVEVGLPVVGKVTRNICVCFEGLVNEHRVELTRNLAESKEDLWFQENDYQRMHDKNLEVLKKASSNKNKKYCVRGLESLMRVDEIDLKRQSARHAVFSEQYFQQTETMSWSEELIATLYRVATRDSCSEAAGRAAQDANEVESYLRDTRKEQRRRSLM